MISISDLKAMIADLPDETPVRLSYFKTKFELYQSKNSDEKCLLLALDDMRHTGAD